MAGSKAPRTGPRSGAVAAKSGSAGQRSGSPGAKGSPAAKGARGGSSGGGARNGNRTRQGAAAQQQPVTAATPAVDGPPAWLRWTTLVLALAGLGVSTYLTIAHYTTAVTLACPNTGTINCQKVTTSPESNVFGIPVAVLGLAFYLFLVAIMSPFAWRSARREVALVRLLSLVAGIGFVIYLIYAELFEIGNICLECTSVHVITFVLFVLTMLSAAVWGGTSQTSKAGRARR
ncbi:MAG TPA: vitamin K epoxide reductase family protein [Streptosporangiaceae bacterium]|nr:vitamin K epoxide reductase family protein [Streptosporangiaceae bacterium]